MKPRRHWICRRCGQRVASHRHKVPGTGTVDPTYGFTGLAKWCSEYSGPAHSKPKRRLPYKERLALITTRLKGLLK